MQTQRSFLANFYKGSVALLMAIALSACTPTYDWRTVKSDDLLFEALYPGKPTRAEKTLLIADQKIKMTGSCSCRRCTLCGWCDTAD